MTPEERDELNAAVTRLVQPDLFDLLGPVNYLGDARLWAPILEWLGKLWWVPFWRGDYWEFRHDPPLSAIDLSLSIANEPVPFIETYRRSGEQLPEAALRLFVALKGEV